MDQMTDSHFTPFMVSYILLLFKIIYSGSYSHKAVKNNGSAVFAGEALGEILAVVDKYVNMIL